MEILLIVLVVVLAVLALCALAWLWAISPGRGADFSEFKKYEYAHRGLHNREQGVPENSLKAFSLAALCGFGMELDLQLTKDNVVVVHHDHSILRSCGADKIISDLTWEELRQYRLFGTEEHIPLFSEVLRLVDGRTPLIVELKSYNDTDTLCTLAMRELDGYQGLYCVESFDPRIVRWFRKNRPNIVRGQLMERLEKSDEITAAQAFFARNLMTNGLTHPHFEAYDFHAHRVLGLKAVRALYGMQEVSWTLRTEEEFNKAKAMGNLCIFERFIPAREAHEELRTFEDALAAYRQTVAAPAHAAVLPPQE